MEHFEEIALDYKPAKWLRHSHGSASGTSRTADISSPPQPTLRFTMEVEVNNTLPFLEVFVLKRVLKLATKVYGKRTRTGRYPHFKSSFLHHLKRRLVQSLIVRAKVIYQNQKGFSKEIKSIRHDLTLT
jgi:hypothetical protein